MKKNIIFLFLVQASNYLFPLLTLPYLMRVLGVENFGLMAMVQASIQYAVIFIDYGFNFSATMLIARNKNNRNKINEIYTVTTISKLILFLIVALIYLVYLSVFGSNVYTELILWGGIAAIGTVIFPVWLFQGLEQMKGIAINSVVSKTVTLLLIFIIVRKPEDTNLAILSQSVGIFISAIFACFYIYKNNMAMFTKIKVRDVLESLKYGFDLFLSNITISFYTTLNIIIIGYLGGPALAGYFSAADKIKTAALGMLSPVQQALFPRVSTMVNEGSSIQQILNSFGKKFILYGAVISLLLMLIGYPVSYIYFSDEYRLSSNLLLVMSPLPFIVSIAVVFGQWWLITNDLTKIVRKIYIGVSILHVIMAIVLMKIFPNYGVAFSIVITEIVVSLLFVKVSLSKKSPIK